MRYFHYCLVVVCLLSSPAWSLPLYKVEKGGRVNWLVGTVHVKSPKEPLLQTLAPLLRQARIVFTENGDSQQRAEVTAEVEKYERLKAGSDERSMASLLGLVGWLKTRPILVEGGLDPSELGFISGLRLSKELDQAFSRVEANLIFNRLNHYDGTHTDTAVNAEKSLRRIFAREGLKTKNPGDVELAPMDFQVVALALEYGLPIRKLKLAPTAFPDAEIKTYVDSRLRRLESIEKAEGFELLTLAVEVVRQLEWNLIDHYWRWTPEEDPVRPRHPISVSVKAPLSPQFLLATQYQYLDWLALLQAEFNVGGVFVAASDDQISHGLVHRLRSSGYEVTFIGGPNCQDLLR